MSTDADIIAPTGSRERTLELLADRALVGLDGVDAMELDRLFIDFPELDDDSMDRSAAALCAALLEPEPQVMPEELQGRVRETSKRWLAARRTSPRAVVIAPHARRVVEGGAARQSRQWRLGPLGWLAAAAALVVAALAWWPSVTVARSMEERRAELLRTSANIVEWPWTRIEHPLCSPTIGGDVVWSGARQEGFLRIRGLAANDPSVRQYQLWIFDATRDEKYPVDGGVFDIPPDCGEAVIPIRAAIDVRQPAMFAVTVEPPGGVVVSKRELVAIAKP